MKINDSVATDCVCVWVQDIQRKERMTQPGDESGEEGEHSGSLVSLSTSHTHHCQHRSILLAKVYSYLAQHNSLSYYSTAQMQGITETRLSRG